MYEKSRVNGRKLSFACQYAVMLMFIKGNGAF